MVQKLTDSAMINRYSAYILSWKMLYTYYVCCIYSNGFLTEHWSVCLLNMGDNSNSKQGTAILWALTWYITKPNIITISERK